MALKQQQEEQREGEGGGNCILTSNVALWKMHESGQCGSPPRLKSVEDALAKSERISGLQFLILLFLLPALDSEHMPKRIRAALICTQCEIQLGMPQVQPEAPQQ